MLAQMKQENRLYQENIVYEIKKLFGEEFVYLNKNGNWAIEKGVLREFRKLTSANVVWDRFDLSWRFRLDNDPPNIRQVDN